ncbi:hypothetical protein GCM10023094_47580 [Rhodococcus olei]|uniref:DUF732 domain-containing protein n=1 Tax=Rhodococcus olei TaxID=2161675 RepID=A0ABP8PKV5_9NOCA
MKSLTAIALTALAVGVLAGCGDGDSDGTDDMRTGMGHGATSAGNAIDQAKLKAFVVSFRTGYGELATNRSDEDIEKIVTQSCGELASGMSKETVTANIEAVAANGPTKPTPEQSADIYNLVHPACP